MCTFLSISPRNRRAVHVPDADAPQRGLDLPIVRPSHPLMRTVEGEEEVQEERR